MTAYESKVTRLTDTGSARFLVEFIGDNGESVSVECAPPPGVDEPTREEIVEEARKLASAAGGKDAPAAQSATYAAPAAGLMRPPAETEARIHTSDGRDRGTE